MSSKLFRLRDLCRTHKSYHPSTDYLCRIIEIKDSEGELHYEYDVITGHGDRNSKLKLKLEVIAYISGGGLAFDFGIVEAEKEIIVIDNMHNIGIIDVDDNIKRSREFSIKKKVNMEKNILFLKKMRNRQDKLEMLIQNKPL